MFEKSKAKAILDHTLIDIQTISDEFSKLYVHPNVDSIQVELLYVALSDYFLFIHQKSKIGDELMKIFVKTRCQNIPENYMIDLYKETHNKIFDTVKSEMRKTADTELGFFNGIDEVNKYFAELMDIDINDEKIKDILDWIASSRYKECQ